METLSPLIALEMSGPKCDKVVMRKGSMGRKLDPRDGGGNCGLKSSPFLGLVDRVSRMVWRVKYYSSQ